MVMISCRANGLRTSEVRNPVDCAAANRDLGRLRINATRPKTIARERLDPTHCLFDKGHRWHETLPTAVYMRVANYACA